MSIQGLFRYQTFIRSELVERIEELEVERDRYREALNVITKETIDIGIHDIAEKALETDF
jgi:hypothetical protein